MRFKYNIWAGIKAGTGRWGKHSMVEQNVESQASTRVSTFYTPSRVFTKPAIQMKLNNPFLLQ